MAKGKGSGDAVLAGRSRKARQDGVETREAILAAAEQEFAEKGFALASAREICRRAKANSALMNRYFGSKEALYRIVAKRLFGDLGAPLALAPRERRAIPTGIAVEIPPGYAGQVRPRSGRAIKDGNQAAPPHPESALLTAGHSCGQL